MPCQAAVQVHTPVETILIEQVQGFDQKTDRETRRALRQEFKKARKEAKAAGDKDSKGLAITGFVLAVLSFLSMFGGLVGASLGVFGLLFFVGGLVLSIISLSMIKSGRMDDRHKWMPITSLVLAGVQVLLMILAIILVVGLLAAFF